MVDFLVMDGCIKCPFKYDTDGIEFEGRGYWGVCYLPNYERSEEDIRKVSENRKLPNHERKEYIKIEKCPIHSRGYCLEPEIQFHCHVNINLIIDIPRLGPREFPLYLYQREDTEYGDGSVYMVDVGSYKLDLNDLPMSEFKEPHDISIIPHINMTKVYEDGWGDIQTDDKLEVGFDYYRFYWDE